MAIMSWAIVVYAPAQELNAKININHSQIQGTDVSVFEELKDKLEEIRHPGAESVDGFLCSYRI